MIKATKIELDRWEGRTSEVGKEVVEGGDVWAKANAVLLRWSLTAPERHGGCHKMAFEVTYEDGHTYGGRMELRRHEPPRIDEHMRRYCEVHTGRHRLPGWSEERYREYLRIVKPEAHEAFTTMLEKYEIGRTESETSSHEAWLEAMGAL